MKKLKILLSLILCLLLLAGCSTDKTASAAEIADSIKSLTGENINWVEMDRSKIPTYFGFSDSSIDGFKAYISSGEESFDLIAVFSYEDDAAREDILNGADSVSSQMSSNYRLVSESEANKINNMLLFEKDNTVILCIVNDYETVKKYLSATGHEPVTLPMN